MKFIFILISLVFSLPAFSVENFKGAITLWKRQLCLETRNCPLPEPIGPKWIAELAISKPVEPGTTSVAKQTLKQAPWTVQLSMYWVQPKTRIEKDYIITQTRLTHDTLGFISECSRYDYLENIKGFPTGACSGRMGNEQLGMTMQRQ